MLHCTCVCAHVLNAGIVTQMIMSILYRWIYIFNASIFSLQPDSMSRAVTVSITAGELLTIDRLDVTMGSIMVCQQLPIHSF